MSQPDADPALSAGESELLDRFRHIGQKMKIQNQLFALVCTSLRREPLVGADGAPLDWQPKVHALAAEKDQTLPDFVCMSMEGIFSCWYDEFCVGKFTVKQFETDFANNPQHVLEQMMQDLKGANLEAHRFVSTDVWKLLQSAQSAKEFFDGLAELYASHLDVEKILDCEHDAAFTAWTHRSPTPPGDASAPPPAA